MTPIDILKAWLAQQPEEVRSDVAFFVIAHVVGRAAFEDDHIDVLTRWLDDTDGFRPLVSGRALVFRSVVEFGLGSRFGEEGWQESEDFFRSVIQHAKDDVQSAEAVPQPNAERMLARIPDRRDMWKAAGESWRRMVEAELTDKKLRSWQRSALMKK